MESSQAMFKVSMLKPDVTSTHLHQLPLDNLAASIVAHIPKLVLIKASFSTKIGHLVISINCSGETITDFTVSQYNRMVPRMRRISLSV